MKMAPSVDAVEKTLVDLTNHVAPIAERQLTELKTFCAEKGFKAPLERWDLPYWRRRYREAKLGIDEGDMKQLFALPAVIDVGFSLVFCLLFLASASSDPKRKLWSRTTDIKHLQTLERFSLSLSRTRCPYFSRYLSLILWLYFSRYLSRIRCLYFSRYFLHTL